MKKFIPKSIIRGNNIKVNVTHIYIPKGARGSLGAELRVDVYYDSEKKAIQIRPSETGLLYVKPNFQINGQFSEVLPTGPYMYREKDNVYIYAGELI